MVIPGYTSTVAVIGSGAIGGYYGARLIEGGHDVRFLMRRDYEAVKKYGLKISSPDGDITLKMPSIARYTRDIGEADWIICALKATSIQEARELIRPCIKDDTRIIALMNGLGIEECFAEWFGPERVFGGLAFACINRGVPGVIHHLAYGQLTIGHFQNNPTELDLALKLWEGSKVRVSSSPSLLLSRWEKLCWNIPFNGMAIAAGGLTTDRILDDPGLREQAREIMEEVIRSGNKDLEAHASNSFLDRESIIDRLFRLTGTMGEYRPSTMIDYLEGREMEIEAIFGEPLRRSHTLGVDTPRLEFLTALLRVINEKR